MIDNEDNENDISWFNKEVKILVNRMIIKKII